VDHATFVRVVQRIGDLRGDARGIRYRKLPLALEPRAERLALHEGHHVVEQTGRASGIEEREDVRVLQIGRELYLAEKSLRSEQRRELGVKHLDRDAAMVLEVLREIDRRHPARTELAFDAIAVGDRAAQPREEGSEIAAPGVRLRHLVTILVVRGAGRICMGWPWMSRRTEPCSTSVHRSP
jgi:hypothetical protein